MTQGDLAAESVQVLAIEVSEDVQELSDSLKRADSCGLARNLETRQNKRREIRGSEGHGVGGPMVKAAANSMQRTALRAAADAERWAATAGAGLLSLE